MAALLRNEAARRLGGSVLERTKAALTSPAVAEERRRLVPRRMFSTVEHPDKVLREIKRKKKELYDAIATVDDSCKTLANMRLHQHLAAEIPSRKNDYVWKKYYAARRTSRLLKKVGILTLPFTVPTFWDYCRSCLGYKKVAPAMMREEEHETISC
ncbi:unnamed protein product [Alopecurus aequalis]